jgi:FkbM family methyltransferase
MILVLPYIIVRRIFRLLLGRRENYRVFGEAGMNSTSDYLEKLKFPKIVRTWIDVRTRFAFEKEVTQAVLRIRGKLFLDIGANMGYYSALLSKNFERILAFEPDPYSMKMLRATVAAGRLCNVTTLSQAVSDRNGTAILHIDPKGSAASITDGRGGRQLPVQSIRLDSIVKENVDLVKVDVEQAEWKVVRGAEVSIRAGRILRWVIEVDDQKTREEIENYLRQRNYSTRWLDARHLFASLARN